MKDHFGIKSYQQDETHLLTINKRNRSSQECFAIFNGNLESQTAVRTVGISCELPPKKEKVNQLLIKKLYEYIYAKSVLEKCFIASGTIPQTQLGKMIPVNTSLFLPHRSHQHKH